MIYTSDATTVLLQIGAVVCFVVVLLALLRQR